MTDNRGADIVVEVGGPNMEPMQRENQNTDSPKDHIMLAIISTFFCPALGLLAIFMSTVSKARYNEGKYKRAEDAARDSRFTAIFGIAAGVCIGAFFLWLYAIVPAF